MCAKGLSVRPALCWMSSLRSRGRDFSSNGSATSNSLIASSPSVLLSISAAAFGVPRRNARRMPTLPRNLNIARWPSVLVSKSSHGSSFTSASRPVLTVRRNKASRTVRNGIQSESIGPVSPDQGGACRASPAESTSLRSRFIIEFSRDAICVQRLTVGNGGAFARPGGHRCRCVSWNNGRGWLAEWNPASARST